MLVFFVGKVDIDGGRTRSAFPWQLRVLNFQLVGHVDRIQMLFQQADVFAVALDGSVRQIANEWDETKDEIQCEIKQHHEQYVVRQTARNFAHGHDEFECEQGVGSVTNGGHETNDRGPTEAHAHETEEREIEPVSGLAGSGEDVGLLLGDVGGDLLLDLLCLAWLPGVGNLLIVRVLTRGQSLIQRNRVEATYIWTSSGLACILAHLACEHLLCRVLCDELGHGCGMVGVLVRNAQKFEERGSWLRVQLQKEGCKKSLYVSWFFWVAWVLWRCVDKALRGGCLTKSGRKLVGWRLSLQKI